MPHDVLTLGRISVDIYPHDIGVDLQDVSTFGRYLGGSPTNVAVAAARHGRSAAVITGTGNDPFGDYLRRELPRFGVAADHIFTDSRWPTPVTFCAIKPPHDFPLYFYRTPTAPDLQLLPEHLPWHEIAEAPVFWFTVTGLCQEPSRGSHHQALTARGRQEADEGRYTILDLDYRPMFWDTEQAAHTAIREVLPQVSVAIGNEQECAVAVGPGSADEQADRLLEAGVNIAVVKRGPAGVLAKTAQERVVSAPVPVETLNGLGAGDSFGGALCHGLLSGWPLALTLDFANAAGAIVASRLSCAEAMPTSAEVIDLLTERGRLVP